jgi:hypothetical protein
MVESETYTDIRKTRVSQLSSTEFQQVKLDDIIRESMKETSRMDYMNEA